MSDGTETATGAGVEAASAASTPTAPVESNPQPSAPEAPAQAPAQPDPAVAARHAQQLQGYRSLAEPLIQAGYNSPEKIAELLSRPQQTATQPHVPAQPPQPAFNEDALLEKMGGLVNQTMDNREALATHTAAEQSMSQGIEAVVQKLTGQGMNETLVRDVIQGEVDRMRKADARSFLYPEGHPKAQEAWRPLTADHIAQVEAKVSGMLGITGAADAGRDMRQRAEQALANVGASTGGVTPSGEQPEAPKPWMSMTPEQRQAEAARVHQQIAHSNAPLPAGV